MYKHTVIGTSKNSAHGQEKRNHLSKLLEAVKACQVKYGGRKELATESDNQVVYLCECLENVFNHGLRSRPLCNSSSAIEQVAGIVARTLRFSQETPCFWQFVGLFLTRHELNRYLQLKNVWTEVGKGRAWLRSSLNERSLERYLSMFLSSSQLRLFYHSWALLLDQELNSTLPNVAAGLGSIVFAISIDVGVLNESPDTADLNSISPTEPVLTVPSEEILQPKPGRTSPVHIVSFDPIETQPNSSMSGECGNVLVTPDEEAAEAIMEDECDKVKENLVVSGNSPSPSSNDSSLHEFDATLPKQEVPPDVATLTPVNDEGHVGELMLISTDELPVDQVSISEADDISVEGLLERRRSADTVTSADLDQLYSTLEQLVDANTGLKSKLKLTLTRHRTEHINTENRLTTITRENEVLKHQLRKYVSAVQMLNKDGAAHEALAYLEASHVAATQREEATKYQEQLVQVAQMHGELMEFNERLQKVLLAKEDVIRRLERELTDLRGPLPPGTVWEDDNSPPPPDALVNVWIPSAFLTGGSSSVHHLYQIYIKIRDTEWNIYRRYAQFYSLHKILKKSYPVVATLDFPPKKTIGNKDAKFVEERRQKLQRYLRQAVDVVARARPDMSDPASLIKIIPFFGQNVAEDEGKIKTKVSVKKRGRTGGEMLSATQYNGF